jgi:hypothetical protein
LNQPVQLAIRDGSLAKKWRHSSWALLSDKKKKGETLNRKSEAGVPDFSWHNIPKRGDIYQMTATLPNGHKIYQLAVKYSKWPYQHFPF